VPGGEPPPEPRGPIAAKPAAPPPSVAIPSEQRPWWKSPWFWGPVGGVAATGIAVLVLSRTLNTSGDVHLTGKVGP
jgi:hypothetical protein